MPTCSCDLSVSVSFRYWLYCHTLPGEASWQAIVEIQDYRAKGCGLALEGKEAMDAISKESFGLMKAWTPDIEEAEKPSKSPMVRVCDNGIMKSGKLGRGAGSKANLI